MEKIVFKTTYTDQQFRQVIREEFLEALKIDRGQDETLLNINKAIEFLRNQHGRDLKPGYIYQLVHKKELLTKNSGKKLLFSKADLSAWAQQTGK